MAWTQADADALRAAIRTGARKVKFKDREVEYHNLAEMRSLLAEMDAALAAAASGAPSNVSVVTVNKGFDRSCYDE